MRDNVQGRIHKEFKKTIDSMYPEMRSLTQKTLKLNEKLIELIGKEKARK